MLVGLLFAIDTAADDAATPVACLPFAGTTLIEHQARRLLAAGVRQIVVVTRDASPVLLAAIGRIGRRGAVVDPVRGMAEAAERIHPLARVLVLADGLTTTDVAVATVTPGESGDVLLTVASDGAPATLERIGGARAWAGIARLDPARVLEAGRLPADYAPQPTLLRVAEAAGAEHRPLPLAAIGEGHAVERDAATLRRRARSLTVKAAEQGDGWFDRWVVAPIARLAMPRLVEAGLPTAAAGGRSPPRRG